MCLIRNFVFLFVLLVSFQSYGQTDSVFWFAAPDISNQHDQGDEYIELRMASSSDVPVTVTVRQPAAAANSLINNLQPIIINPGQSYTLNLNRRYANGASFKTILETTVGSIRNSGLLVTSQGGPITAYYEVGRATAFPGDNIPDKNGEIFTLKGQNALGTRFFTPFQNYYQTSNMYSDAFNTINIVATQNATNVTFRLTRPGIGIANQRYNAGQTYTVSLNRGQTFSIRAAGDVGANNAGFNSYDRMAGSEITSDKPIAVTVADDSPQARWDTGADLIGDQIIPVNLLGREYIVVRGFLGNNNSENRVFIVATENNTNIQINGNTPGGGNGLNAGQTFVHQLPSGGGILSQRITSDKPVYVYYVSGYGSEMGGPLLPSIQCTGSTEVDFVRSSTDPFFLTIIAREEGLDNFLVENVSNVIRRADFVSAGNGWWVAQKRMDGTSLPSGIPVNVGVSVRNTRGYFHLGIINGQTAGGTSRFGYFSDYGKIASKLPSSLTICPGTNTTLDPMVVGVDPSKTRWYRLPDKTNPISTNPTLQISTAGSYSVYLEDVRQCKFEDTVVLNLHTLPPFDLGKASDTVCFNVNEPIRVNGTWTNINWTRRPTGVTIPAGATQFNPRVSGVYEVTVTDNNTCTQKDQVNITYTNELSSFDLGAQSRVVCFNAENPIRVTTNYPVIRWVAPVTIPNGTLSYNPTVSGKYKVTVTDRFRCTASDSVNVTFSDKLKDFNLEDGPKTVCFNKANPIRVIGNYARIRWTGPVVISDTTTKTYNPTRSGWYKVTVFDDVQCQAADSVNVIFSDTLKDFELVFPGFTKCFNEVKPIEVKGTYNTIIWNAPETVAPGTKSHNPTKPGKYEVTVSDSKGCEVTKSLNVAIEDGLIGFDLGPESKGVCFNGSNEVTNVITVNVDKPDNVIWTAPVSIAPRTMTWTVTRGGKYIVRVEKNGCNATDSIQIDWLDDLKDFDLGKDTSVVCFQTLNPIVVAGGPYRLVEWTAPVSIANDVLSHQPTVSGEYTVKVHDFSGCSVTDKIGVTIADGLKNFNLGDDQKTVCFNVVNPIKISGGPFSKTEWTGPVTIPPGYREEYNPTRSGIYTVVVFDAFGCNAKDEVDIKYVPSFNLDLGDKIEACSYHNYVIDVTRPDIVQYLWATNVDDRQNTLPGVTESVYKADTTGLYSVKLVDINGCSDEDTVSFLYVPDLSLEIGSTQIACEVDSFIINPQGNFGSYVWGNDAGVQNPDNDIRQFRPIKTGNYWLEVWDVTGTCKDSDTLEVKYVEAFNFEIGSPFDTVCFNEFKPIKADPKFDNGFTWEWVVPSGETNPGSATFHQPVKSGKYIVKVTDINTCTESDSVEITYSNLLFDFSLISGNDTLCFYSLDTIRASDPKFNSNFTWSWQLPVGANTPINGRMVIPNKQGNYIATLVDRYGCTNADTVSISYSEDLLGFDLGGGIDTICFNNPKTIKATDPKYNQGFTWNWQMPDGVSDPGNVTEFTPDKSGTYTVTIIDRLNCTATDEVLIKYSNILMNFDLGAGVQNVCAGTTGLITTQDSAYLSQNFNWNWTVPASSENPGKVTSFIPRVEGIYAVVIQDTLLCSVKDEVNVKFRPPINLNLGNSDTTACGYTNYIINPGPGYASYTWSDNVNAAPNTTSFTPIRSGLYWVEVADSIGCKQRDSVELNYIPGFSVDLGDREQVVCNNLLPFEIKPTEKYTAYLWSNGSTDSSYTTNFPDDVATVKYEKLSIKVWREHCEATDEITLKYVNFVQPHIGDSAIVCPGTVVTMDPGPGFNYYYWFRSDRPNRILSEERVFSTSEPGFYYVSLHSECGITPAGKMIGNFEQPLPIIRHVIGNSEQVSLDTLSSDTVSICLDEHAVLVPFGSYKSYSWALNTKNNEVSKSSTYYSEFDNLIYLSIIDTNNCQNYDSVFVVTHDRCFKIPNLITPNEDEFNQRFVVKGIRRKEWSLLVYNRWGQLVYDNPAYDNEWEADGLSDGVYYYQLKNDKRRKLYKGWVEVLDKR